MKTKIGFVGVGNISGIYFENITKRFRDLEIAGICDLIPEKAEKAAKKYGISKIYKDMHELFADPEVDIVLNITRPYEHFDVSLAALNAGKHVYCEKPLGVSIEEGKILTALAKEKGLYLGGAPDTFLGAGIQTCRALVDEGAIGSIVGAAAFMICHGHETWHPDPEFYYKRGGGPMFDMGPYYLTALVNLLGPVQSVSGMTGISFPQRTITSEPLNGTVIDVDVPTYVTGLLQFTSGAIGTIFTTFDVHYDHGARLEVYGSEGTLQVPDPNGFGGPVELLKGGARSYKKQKLRYTYEGNSRALGLADMASAIASKRAARCNSDMTNHVLEIMCALHIAAAEKRQITLETTFERCPLMAKGLPMGKLD